MGDSSPDFSQISALQADAQGIWFAPGTPEVNYPEANHGHTFEVEDHSWWYAHRARVVLDMVRRHPPPGFILDVGGGNGFMTRALQQAGYPAVLLNPASAGIENGRKRGLEAPIRGDFTACGFDAGVLPAVALFDVLEHIADAGEFLTRVHQALDVGGRLYLTLPAYRWLWSGFDEFAGHQTRYTVRRAATALRNAGFHTLFASYYFAPMVLPQILLRSLPWRLGLARKSDGAALKSQLGRGLTGRLANAILAPERWWMARGWRIPAGSSCLLAAEKPA